MTPSGNFPRFIEIGSGSGAELASLGSLIAPVLSQRTDFTSRSIATANEVEWTFDINSVQMSGINLREFGIGQVQTKGTNDLWNREAFDAVTFNGGNELQIIINFQIT